MIEQATSRVCTRCGVDKPLDAFARQKKGLHGRTSWCKPCRREVDLARKERDPEGEKERQKARAKRWRERHKPRLADEWKRRRREVTLAQYGLTLEAYDGLLAAQGFVCAICASPDPIHWSGQFQVDHCHETGRVRGLLCASCNGGLGLLGDGIDRLEAAIRYLEEAQS